ncbi:hypothetical protein HJG60_011981 [Phyllostomus discolor]|uniref:Uncharacterized protein n=1 Tax=Phyllostomus discolor TaxID=89673 RepID=A0A833ZDD5_9CHIR|nr:hypothetical protein HJG60_011981 [Phyllostomus discolor]
MLLQLSHFPLHSPPPCTPSPTHIPPLSSCPCVILISSLASTFPILFLPSPYLFSTYILCYLFSVPFPPLSSSHPPAASPPCALHFCGSVPVLVVYLASFGFALGVVVDICEFAVLLLYMSFLYLLFLDKSL